MLDSYRGKRSFPGTLEPQGVPSTPGSGLVFVVQKHAARRLHYDFRLEVDGVLKSWAVPRGPSSDPREKRLAVQVEDHPFDYATFEGVIPERRYGAGNVIVWDYGSYSPDDDDRLSFDDPEEANQRMRRQLESGKVSITLRGSKLRGSWALVKTKGQKGATNQWLLIKHRDDYAGLAQPQEDETSVISGRTLEEVSRGVPPVLVSSAEVGRPAPFPTQVRPMLATLVARPFSQSQWLFEPKLDGIRAVAYLQEGQVELRARSEANITDHYPEIAQAVASLQVHEAVLDGEIVALNDRGIPDFELLQQRMHLHGQRAAGVRERIPVVYYVFDLLYAQGRDLTGVPLVQRKGRLRQLLPESELVRLVHCQEGDGERFFQGAVAMGLEGVVAKRCDSLYEGGVRSRAWLKIKAEQEQEFVVCGYLPGRGHRAGSFGALVLGYYEGEMLKYGGTVGSGFREQDLAALRRRLADLAVEEAPFQEAIPRQAEKPAWVRPVLVARVKFAAWTKAGYLRAPVYLGLREDMPPRAVVRERPLTQPPDPPGRPDEGGQDQVAAVCQQLDHQRESLTIMVAGERIKVTNLNKVLWPAAGKRAPLTKRDFIRYLVLASPHLLPHLQGRPMNLTRYPEGIERPGFYQKHWPTERPPFVTTVSIYSPENRTDQEYIIVENLPTLVWLGQLAAIELHPWLSRVEPQPDAPLLSTSFSGSEAAIDASVLSYPDFIIFDLDPYIYSGQEGPRQEPELNRRGFERAREVAFALKEVLEALSLTPFVKTSGKTGLHLYVPVLRHYDYGLIRKACGTIGKFLSASKPGTITLDWAVERRTGKVFFDHNQNGRGKTLAAPYSLRPTAGATVSTPISWKDLATVYPTDFTIATVPLRLSKAEDPWRGILDCKHDLRPLFEEA